MKKVFARFCAALSAIAAFSLLMASCGHEEPDPTPPTPQTVAVTGVTLSSSSMTLKVGETGTLSYTISPSNATNTNVIWKSNDGSIATIDVSGKVTGVKAGTTTIQVITTDGAKTASCTVTVTASNVAVTGVSLDDASKTLTIGERNGSFAGMLESRRFHVIAVTPGSPAGYDPDAEDLSDYTLRINFRDALLYLRICLLGLVPQLVYNVANGVFRALGNTKTPLRWLGASAVLNIALDLFLVGMQGFGFAGAAWATLAAQWALGLAMIWRLMRIDERFRFSFDAPLLSARELLALLRLGIPSGMQAAFMSLSSLLIQVSIDSFGPAAMAGMVIYAKIEGFLYYPAFAYGMALTGFIGQNLGAGRLDRVEEAMRVSRRTAIYGTMAICAALALAAEPILACFTEDAATLANGLAAVYWTFPFYFLYSLNQVYIGGLKGLGETGVPMLSALVAYALFRVVWCETLLPHWHDMAVIYNAYNVSFVISLLILVPAYRHAFRHAAHPAAHDGVLAA